MTLDLSNGLEPDEAAVLAVLVNPDLVAARDEHGIARAELITARLLPNPVFSAEFDEPYRSPGGQSLSYVLNLSLSMDTKAFLTRDARIEVARGHAEQVDLGIAWQEWQLAQKARLLVIQLSWIDQRLLVARDELQFQERIRGTLQQAEERGDVTIAQLGVQTASAEAVRTTVLELEQSKTTKQSELATVLGQPGALGLRTVPASELGVRGLALDETASMHCIEHRMDLQALRRGYASEQAALRQAVLEQFPAVTVGINHQHNESHVDFVGAFLSFELPIFDRAQGRIALERATRERLRHDYASRVLATRSDLHRLSALVAVIEQQLPQIRAAVATLSVIERRERSAFEGGNVDQLSYQSVRNALFEQRLHQAAQEQARDETLAGLQAACGEPLSSVAIRRGTP